MLPELLVGVPWRFESISTLAPLVGYTPQSSSLCVLHSAFLCRITSYARKFSLFKLCFLSTLQFIFTELKINYLDGNVFILK